MMNNIGTLYTYELKKIANRKLVWIVGMIMIALSMFLSVSNIIVLLRRNICQCISSYEIQQR